MTVMYDCDGQHDRLINVQANSTDNTDNSCQCLKPKKCVGGFILVGVGHEKKETASKKTQD